jgi:hypothetical protein
MPRLARKWGQWFAQAREFLGGNSLISRSLRNPIASLLGTVSRREIIRKKRGSVNGKITLVDG